MQRHKIRDVPFDIFNICWCIRYKSKKASNALFFKEIVIAKNEKFGSLDMISNTFHEEHWHRPLPNLAKDQAPPLLHLSSVPLWLAHDYRHCWVDFQSGMNYVQYICSNETMELSYPDEPENITPKMAKIRNCLKLNFTCQWTKNVSDSVDLNIRTEFAVCTEQNILISFPIVSQQTNISKEPKYREIDLSSKA